MVVHTFSPSTKSRGSQISVSSKTARITQRVLVSKKQQTKKIERYSVIFQKNIWQYTYLRNYVNLEYVQTPKSLKIRPNFFGGGLRTEPGVLCFLGKQALYHRAKSPTQEFKTLHAKCAQDKVTQQGTCPSCGCL